MDNQSKHVLPTDSIMRSSAFDDKPVSCPGLDAAALMRRVEAIDAPKRDDRLVLIENLEVGPTDHKPTFDDPHFQHLEPNSDIRLSCVFKSCIVTCFRLVIIVGLAPSHMMTCKSTSLAAFTFHHRVYILWCGFCLINKATTCP